MRSVFIKHFMLIICCTVIFESHLEAMQESQQQKLINELWEKNSQGDVDAVAKIVEKLKIALYLSLWEKPTVNIMSREWRQYIQNKMLEAQQLKEILEKLPAEHTHQDQIESNAIRLQKRTYVLHSK